jgi:methylamine---glutamate N-methyltransferase subunit B
VVSVASQSTVVDCSGKTTREINELIKTAEGQVVVKNPGGRHCLGVAILKPLKVVFDGPVGWYCATMLDGAEVEIHGNCGWSVGQNMMSGSIAVHGHAGSSAGATLRGGTLRIGGDAGARTAISLKGGLVVVGGSVGYMSGFMMQTGTLVVCGNAADGIGDSMYEGTIFVGGSIDSLGSDAVESEVTEEDRRSLVELGVEPASGWTKLVAGRKLWNFSKKEFEVWKVAL